MKLFLLTILIASSAMADNDAMYCRVQDGYKNYITSTTSSSKRGIDVNILNPSAGSSGLPDNAAQETGGNLAAIAGYLAAPLAVTATFPTPYPIQIIAAPSPIQVTGSFPTPFPSPSVLVVNTVTVAPHAVAVPSPIVVTSITNTVTVTGAFPTPTAPASQAVTGAFPTPNAIQTIAAPSPIQVTGAFPTPTAPASQAVTGAFPTPNSIQTIAAPSPIQVTGAFPTPTAPASQAVTGAFPTPFSSPSVIVANTVTVAAHAVAVPSPIVVTSITNAVIVAVPSPVAVTGSFPTPPPSQAVTGAFPTPPTSQAVTGSFPTPPPSQAVTGAFPTPFSSPTVLIGNAVTVAVPSPVAVTGSFPTPPPSQAVTGSFPTPFPSPTVILNSETTKVIGTVNMAASQVIGLATGTSGIGNVRFWDTTNFVTISGGGMNVNDTAPTLTKGTQGSTGFSTQDLKDAGRTQLRFYAVATAAGTTTTETLFTLTKSSGTAATSTGTTFTPTSGKKFRITSLLFASRGNATATIQTTTFNVRVNAAGACIVSSTPIIYSARSATPATASAWDRVTIQGLEGDEITGDGTLQWCVSAAATYVTNAPTWDVVITGYEY